jgi:transcriptional regulator of acetoin/glycerol metabolism
VGGTRSRAVDVQLLAATHTDLDAAVAAGRFRPDLLYRLNTVAVRLPPLRARRDFAVAARQLLGQVDRAASLDEAALARLARYPWPGNFRELRAVLTRALLLAGPGRRLGAAEIERVMPATPVTAASSLQQAAGDTVRREFERCGGSVSRTARVLGISRTTVYRYLREGAAAAVSGR